MYYIGCARLLFFLKSFFLASVVGYRTLSTLSFLHYNTMILQRIRIIDGDAGVEPGTSAQKSGALPMSHHISDEPPHRLYICM